MKSLKQTFGIFIVALALFGAYSLVCPKKPVDDRISDDFRAELEEEGIFLNDGTDPGGKSVLFDSLGGNIPGLPSSAQATQGKSAGSVPPALFGGDASQRATPAPQYTQLRDEDLIVPDFGETPSWNDNPIPTRQAEPEMPELPSLDAPVFDDAPLYESPVDLPPVGLPDVNSPDTFESVLPDMTMEMPVISDSAVSAATPANLDFVTETPVYPPPINETLDSSSAFTPIDSTATIASNLPKGDSGGFANHSSLNDPISYNQREPVPIVHTPLAQTFPDDVRPLPAVTEETDLTFASGNSPAATDRSASTENFSFSNAPNNFQTTDYQEVDNQATDFAVPPETPATQPIPAQQIPVQQIPVQQIPARQTPTHSSDFDFAPNDLTAPSVSEAAPTGSAPGIARSSQRKTVPETAAHAPLRATDSIDPQVMPHEIQVGTTGQLASAVSLMPNTTASNPVARNTVSQMTARPEVMQRLAQIKSILSDENVEYRLGHQLITELYMSDLNFAEREHVLPTADKCGQAAFFSSRFDPYGWGRPILAADTLQSLAAANNVSPELIMKINQLQSPRQLTPGRDHVKIPQGPFDATIFLGRKEMIVTAHGLFACRFRIGVGKPEEIAEAIYRIEDKFQNPRYIGETGEINSGDPRNPLGTHWIQLDQEIGIHGTNNPSCIGTDNAPVEGFSLDNRDVAEVYDIFTARSQITVRR